MAIRPGHQSLELTEHLNQDLYRDQRIPERLVDKESACNVGDPS